MGKKWEEKETLITTIILNKTREKNFLELLKTNLWHNDVASCGVSQNRWIHLMKIVNNLSDFFFVNISKNKCQHFIRLSVIPFLFKNKCPHLVENVAKKSVLLGMSFYRTSTFLILWMSLVIWAISLRCLSITSFKSCHLQTFSTVKILITWKQDKVMFIILIASETDWEYPLYSVCKGHAADYTNILMLKN